MVASHWPTPLIQGQELKPAENTQEEKPPTFSMSIQNIEELRNPGARSTKSILAKQLVARLYSDECLRDDDPESKGQ